MFRYQYYIYLVYRYLEMEMSLKICTFYKIVYEFSFINTNTKNMYNSINFKSCLLHIKKSFFLIKA